MGGINGLAHGCVHAKNSFPPTDRSSNLTGSEKQEGGGTVSGAEESTAVAQATGDTEVVYTKSIPKRFKMSGSFPSSLPPEGFPNQMPTFFVSKGKYTSR